MAKLQPMDRRTLLRGSGGAILALPSLNTMANGPAESTVPIRMVCIGTTYGFIPDLFFPKEAGRDYTFPLLLKPLERHRDHFTIFSHLDHGANAIGGHQGTHAFLSGILSKNSKGFREQNVSVDQKAAAHVRLATRYASMQITSGSDPTNLLSWTASGVAVPPIQDLRALHAMLFQQSTAQERSVLKQLHADQLSILDLVSHDANQLLKRVGTEDKDKLDQYFTAIRSVERRLTASSAWLDRPKPKVSYEVPLNANEMNFIDRVPLYYDLIALALQTDSTRIVTLELSELGPNLGGFPITRGYHQLTHHGKVESYLEELSVIETFHMTQFARFLDLLRGVTEANGKTLLDNTMTLLGSGMGNASSHSNRDLPLLLAGGGFRHGNHLSFDKDRTRPNSTPASNLFVSMLQRFGVETEQFNLSTGTLTGLETTA